MNIGMIGSRYAKALYEFALEKKLAEQVYIEAKAISSSYIQFPELRTVLENPVMAKSEKRKIIVMAAGGVVSSVFERFLDLLFENNREYYLQSMVLKYIDLYRLQNNIHYGKLTTATAVESKVEKRLIDLISQNTGGTLEVEKAVDPAILGGFMFEVDFKQWDASLSGQLNSIRKDYIDKNRNII